MLRALRCGEMGTPTNVPLPHRLALPQSTPHSPPPEPTTPKHPRQAAAARLGRESTRMCRRPDEVSAAGCWSYAGSVSYYCCLKALLQGHVVGVERWAWDDMSSSYAVSRHKEDVSRREGHLSVRAQCGAVKAARLRKIIRNGVGIWRIWLLSRAQLSSPLHSLSPASFLPRTSSQSHHTANLALLTEHLQH